MGLLKVPFRYWKSILTKGMYKNMFNFQPASRNEKQVSREVHCICPITGTKFGYVKKIGTECMSFIIQILGDDVNKSE
jgi:hypothetical protein